MHAQLAAQVAKLDGQGAWQAWSSFAASFHKYSSTTRFCLGPTAGGDLGRRVSGLAGEGPAGPPRKKAIKVLGPVTRRTEVLDAHGNPKRDHTGRPPPGDADGGSETGERH